MKTILKFAVVCTLFVIAAIVIGPSKPSTPTQSTASVSMSTTPAPTPSVTRATPAPIITISADALAEAFDDNEIAAEATYGGTNRITVVGRIKSIGVEIMGHPYVVIEAGNTLTGIQCVFSKTDAETLAKYSKGLRVAITGQMRFGAVLGHLMHDCTIAPIVKKATRVEKAIAVTN